MAAADLLERTDELAALEASLAAARAEGRLVLVSGEAGVGKTALVRSFCDAQRSARILWGACDALFTPRPLLPFIDIAPEVGGELEELVGSGARPYEIARALMRELAARAPTVLVLEDLHWADDATLDVVRLLSRRIEGVPGLVVGSYRDDELDRAHPLRIVLGELATGRAVERLRLAPLSPQAVSQLAEPYAVDAEALHRATVGNPFFVTEVLAASGGELPLTVRDAVLARVARLSPRAAQLLQAVAVGPQRTELWLLEAVADEGTTGLDECLSSGMLTATPGAVAFRHELARLVVEASLAPDRRLALHRATLAALAADEAIATDRLAHHAEAAADADAVLRFAPAAAERASALGAHREAAAQYARALRFADGLPQAARADLLERRAYECYVTGQLGEAIEAQRSALECLRAVGDRRREGDALRSLSRLLRFVGRTAQARETGRGAVAMLEPIAPGRELAMAYCNLSHIAMTAEDAAGSIAWATRALELARRLDDPEVHVYALTNIGAGEFLADPPAGVAKLEESLDLARREGLEEHAGRAFLSLVWWPIRQRDLGLADRYLGPGLEYCSEHGLDLWRLFLLACGARMELDRGRWSEAAQSARAVLRDPRTFPVPRTLALTVLALARARRGDPEVWPPLDEAQALAEPTGELQRIGWVAAARAEAAWLEAAPGRVAQATEAGLELAAHVRASWVVGELACWRLRAGVGDGAPLPVAEPYALQLAGAWERAAELWTALGSPYETALALGDADDEDGLRRGLDELQALGARPAAAIVARRLRERGARGLPRGPRPATTRNPAGLTARELEVLALVTEGLTNADIADRLFLSKKTVAHHVSAVLRKLDARTRGEASAAALRLGLAAQDR